ncbi:COX15/CtaA family protein [Legionella sp. CNM-4043-24]|uniref:COX15/CtaA family protein n=1 Tax=Legionella sp. CNM-4043-24 TaxID=3421646 RepID=UPI00403B02BF
MKSKRIIIMISVAAAFAWFVVMLGAYTRLTNAGLGCPDWPGCYGHLVLPSAEQARSAAQSAWPSVPIEARKAWTEMAHRYAAGTLVLLVTLIALSALRQKNSRYRILPLFLVLLIGFQAALGMWTVTLKLLPVVVMSHLLGGILIFSCLCLLRTQVSSIKAQYLPGWPRWIALGALIVFCQIALGGWVSANYAGIACVGFPQCNGQWLPSWQLHEGFYLLSPVGANYQGGLLDNDARVSIQMVHRIGALVTALYCLSLAISLLVKVKKSVIRVLACLLIVLVLLQISLGILNVIFLLPISIAVAHNGVAALLMATMLVLFYLSTGSSSQKDDQ